MENIYELAKLSITYIVPFLKSKASEFIYDKAKEKIFGKVGFLWEKIKKEFSKERFIEKLEENPTDERAQNSLLHFLSDKLESDKQFHEDFSQALKILKDDKNLKTIIQNHYGTGDNIGGDKNIYN